MTVSLPISGGVTTLSAATFPNTVFQTVLTECGIAAITITGSQSTTASGATQITGTTSLLGASGAAAAGTFSFNADGTLQTGTLRISLPATWTLAAAFPSLPQVTGGVSVPTLTNAALVITTAAGTDSATGAAVQPGLNLVGQTASGIVGVLASVLDGGTPLPVSARISLPAASAPAPAALAFGTLPWTGNTAPPGIVFNIPLVIAKGGIGGGQMALKSLNLTTYLPPSTAWMTANPGYQPMSVVTGVLAIPSANITADITAYNLSANGFCITCQFNGLSLADLSHLSDLTGGSALASALPSDAQTGSALSGLSLEAMTLDLGPKMAVQQVSFTIGMPNLNTAMIPGFTVQGVAASFTVTSPFSQPSVGVMVMAAAEIGSTEVDIQIDVTNETAYLSLPDGANLAVGDLAAAFGLPAAPSAFSLAALDLSIIPGSGFTIQALAAPAPGWTIPLGPTSLTIENIFVLAESVTGSPLQFGLAGELTLAGVTMDVAYAAPGAFSINATLPTVNLSALIQALDSCGVQIPSGFDASLQNGSLLIEEGNGSYTLSAAATVPGLGTVAFISQGQGAVSGIAVGISLGGNASGVTGLGGLSALEAEIGLESLVLVASSLQQPGFQFPAASVFNNPSLTGNVQLPSVVNGLVKGLNIYALLSTTAGSGAGQAIGRLLQWAGIPVNGTVAITTSVSLPNPSTASKLFATLGGQIGSGHSTVTGEAGLLLTNGEAGAFLSATVATTVGANTPVTFDVQASVLENGILISGSAEGTLTVDGIQLSDLSVVIGMDWEGEPSFGIAAQIDSSGFDSSIIVFIDSVNPSNSLFAGCVSGITMLQLAQELVGANAVPQALAPVLQNIGLQSIPLFTLPSTTVTALTSGNLTAIAAAFQQTGNTAIPANNQGLLLITATANALWFLTDLTQMKHYQLQAGPNGVAVSLEPQFYWADAAVTIGANQFPANRFVAAQIDLDIVQCDLQVQATPGQGISGQATLTPITVGSLISITGGTGATGTTGPMLSLSTMAQPSNPDTNLQQPHLLISGKLVICDLSLSVYVDLTQTALDIAINEQFSTALDLNLTCSINRQSLGNSSVSGSLNLAVDDTLNLGVLGSVPIDVTVAASLTLALVNGTPSATLSGSFSFDGDSLTIPSSTVTFSSQFFTNLGGEVLSLMETAAKDLFADAGKWVSAVSSGVVQGFQDVENVASVLSSEFAQAPQLAMTTLKDAGYAADTVASAISGAFNLAAQDVGVLMNDAGYAAGDIATALNNAFAWSANEASNFLNGTLNLGDDAVQGALQAAGYAESEIDDACGWLSDEFSSFFSSW